MTPGACETVDPRMRRTRQLLQESLAKLLEEKEFDKISVGDITGEATVNRATFYDHYADKFALLECVVGSRFHDLLTERRVQFDGCASALKAIALVVCEYLKHLRGRDDTRQLQPQMELAIIAVVRRMLLEGLRRHPEAGTIAPEMTAAAASWAIYGAAKEWTQMPGRSSAEEFANTVSTLVSPILHSASSQAAVR